MNSRLAIGYKSGSQIARVVTEQWCGQNLYCPACVGDRLSKTATNARAIDFNCSGCNARFQLKSSSRWSEDRIVDAAYNAMIAAIREDRTPNLLVLQYSPDWHVRNLLLVPYFFFTESAIECRKPLGPKARRAGWIGCNIRLAAIAPEGKLRLVRDGNVECPQSIREQYQLIRPVSAISVSLRGWTLAVLNVVHSLRRQRFTLADVYELEPEIARRYLGNRNVRAKIRQQLQVLRDLGFLEFLGRGTYSLRQQFGSQN